MTRECDKGVKQGCILSPFLFNISLVELPDHLNHGDARPVKINETKSLNLLIWADDLLCSNKQMKWCFLLDKNDLILGIKVRSIDS